MYVWGGGFSEGLARVIEESGKIGYIDKTGKMVIKPVFGEEKENDFSEGMERVGGKKDTWG